MNSKSILLGILALQFATLVSIFFNVAFARQLLSFLFLTFIPGYLIIRIGKFDNLRFSITIFLSVGVSIGFLMVLGLLLNTLLPILGFPYPLSAFSIVVSVNIFVLVSCAFLWVKNQSFPSLNIPRLRPLPGIILLLSIPFLTVIGVEMARLGNTFVLLMLMVITSLVVMCAFSGKLIPAESYPLVILAISLFLLFHVSLISSYAIGTDVHTEIYFAQLTSANSFWDRTIFHSYNAMLSVTILPVVYERFLNVDATWVFKIVYPLVYSLVPLILYFVYRKQTNSLVAFLAVFFFMSMDTFYVQMLGLARQMVGELFLALLILLLIDKEIDLSKKKLLFVVFSIALLFSHYSLAYLFLFLALATFSVSHYFERAEFDQEREPVGRSMKSERAASAKLSDLSGEMKRLRNDVDEMKHVFLKRACPLITGKFILGYAIVTSAWYIFAVPAASKTFADSVSLIYNSLISNTSGPGVAGLMPPAISPVRQASGYLFYLLQLFVLVGIIALIIRHKKPQFIPEYAGMSIGGLLLLLMSVFLPDFAASLNMTRIYHISLFLLAPFCVLGCMSIVGLMANMKSRLRFSLKEFDKVTPSIRRAGMLLIALMLICLFLFQVGFIYKITGDNNTGSISLSMDAMNSWTIYMNQLYVDEREVSSLKWFAKYENNESRVYADTGGSTYLMSYGLVSPKRLDVPEPEMSTYWVDISYLFFDRLNVNGNTFVGWSKTWNSTDFSSVINETDQIYCNSASTFYCGHSTGVVPLP